MTINRDTILRMIFCIDFIFVSMVLMDEWLPKSYLFNQMTILALGFWAIVHRGSVIQVELLMLIKFFSIIIDSIAIGMYFQAEKHSPKTGFVISVIFAIFLLILKPIMLLLLNKVRQDRLNDSAYDAWTPKKSGYIPVDEEQVKLIPTTRLTFAQI